MPVEGLFGAIDEMKREDFNALVTRLEVLAKERPATYRFRVGALAALGYAYVLLLLGIVAGLMVFVAWVGAEPARGGNIGGIVRIELFLGVFAFLFLRALWVRFPRPTGIKLRRDEVPEVFRFVDELTGWLHAPRFSYILLTNDFNAAVLQRSVLGIFGLHENYLLLGLPLMEALTPDQFRSVIAHEMGHSSGNHGRFSAWIYRVRSTWGRLMAELQARQSWGTWLMKGFLNWYGPFFDAYSFVLARQHEYEADRCAAAVTSPRIAAEALLLLHVKERRLGAVHWPAMQRQVRQQPEPVSNYVSQLIGAVRAPVGGPDVSKWLPRALAESTSTEDTHPSLSDRLRSLGVTDPPDIVASQSETAAAFFLGAHREKFAAAFDKQWMNESGTMWKQQHEQSVAAEKELAELNGRASLSEDEDWRRICLTGELAGDETALPMLETFAGRYPNHAGVNFALGRILLDREDERGLEFMRRAMDRDAHNVLPGCEAVTQYLRLKGRLDELPEYQRRAEKQHDVLTAAQEERAIVTERDKVEPNGLEAAVIVNVRRQLAAFDVIAEAYLIRKVVKYLPEKPVLVLVVLMKDVWYKFQSDAKYAALSEDLVGKLNIGGNQFWVFVVGKRRHAMLRKARKVAGSRVVPG
jgi:Zn-dependent protease with chaperone function